MLEVLQQSSSDNGPTLLAGSLFVIYVHIEQLPNVLKSIFTEPSSRAQPLVAQLGYP